jgi:hypothetical protein
MTSFLSVAARDTRIARATEQVLARYTITPAGSDAGWLVFKVQGGSSPYEVRVHPEWADDPTCSCPDASDHDMRMHRGYCKHLIAVLRRERALSYQLLELYL